MADASNSANPEPRHAAQTPKKQAGRSISSKTVNRLKATARFHMGREQLGGYTKTAFVNSGVKRGLEIERKNPGKFASDDDFERYVAKIIENRIKEVGGRGNPAGGHAVPIDGQVDGQGVVLPDQRSDPTKDAENKDALRQIQELVTPEEFDLLKAYYGDGQTSSEMAQKLGISPAAFRQRTHRILSNLREAIG
jgi:RNA polymerase sigma factor (sigma-70 family)